MSGIFVSYRRETDSGWAGRLVADLRREFPENEVFQDISSIAIGEDFVDALGRALESCAVVLVVIGPFWLNLRDESGQRRLDDPEDWVRLEVEQCLKRSGLRVVPLLVGGARMPKASDLPDPLRPLWRRAAHEVSEKRWAYDLSELARALKQTARLTAEPTRETGGAPVGAAPGRLTAGFRDGEGLPEMVVVPAGEFLMGSPPSEAGRTDDEGPQHRVWIARHFALGRCPVTVGEFRRFVEASGYRTKGERDPERGIRGWDEARGKWVWSTGASWRQPGFSQDDRHPVVGVSWNDAQAYVRWIAGQTGKGYRLPSEAEWEYACRAGSTSARFWGDDPAQAFRWANVADRSFKAAHPGWRWAIHDCDDGYAETSPVASFAANAFGLCDMIGNVWEWTEDCWNDSYSRAPADGSAWLEGDCARRVVRGGSWGSGPESARSANRNWSEPDLRSDGSGFRVARTL